jgi:cyclopropane fatty-acyl-phospholipid synthase-like methyltransferase
MGQTKDDRVSFDTLAPVYRLLEAVLAGPMLQRCRISFLEEAVHRRRALVLGEGPGLFLVELMRSAPEIEVTCVEQSTAMIRQAIGRLRRAGVDCSRIDFLQMDALHWKPSDRRFDLIVTHFFLDCFSPEELAGLVAKLGSCSTKDARWLLGDFCIPERGWQRVRARAIHAAMYASFRATTGLSAKRLTPPDDSLRTAGFRLLDRRLFNFGLLHSDLWIRHGS